MLGVETCLIRKYVAKKNNADTNNGTNLSFLSLSNISFIIPDFFKSNIANTGARHVLKKTMASISLFVVWGIEKAIWVSRLKRNSIPRVGKTRGLIKAEIRLASRVSNFDQLKMTNFSENNLPPFSKNSKLSLTNLQNYLQQCDMSCNIKTDEKPQIINKIAFI